MPSVCDNCRMPKSHLYRSHQLLLRRVPREVHDSVCDFLGTTKLKLCSSCLSLLGCQRLHLQDVCLLKQHTRLGVFQVNSKRYSWVSILKHKFGCCPFNSNSLPEPENEKVKRKVFDTKVDEFATNLAKKMKMELKKEKNLNYLMLVGRGKKD